MYAPPCFPEILEPVADAEAELGFSVETEPASALVVVPVLGRLVIVAAVFSVT